MDKVELRRKRIINLVYLAIIIGIAYLFLKYFFWIFFPFLFSLFVAVLVQKPANFIERKTKIKKGITTTFLVILTILLFIVLVSLLGMKLVDAGKGLFDYIRGKLYDFPALIENVRIWVIKKSAFLPDSLEAKFTASANSWFDIIKNKSASEIAAIIVDSASGGEKFSISSLSTPLSGILSTAKQIPSVFLAVMITVLSSCFMAADYDWISTFIRNQLSENHQEKLSRSKQIVFTSIGKLIRSYIIIIGITGTELFVGLSILSLAGIYDGGHLLGISIIIALLDILPVLGTGTFMVPWIIYSFITDNIALGIGLLIVYAIICVVRQIAEPKLVGGTVGLPAFVTLMAMYVGSQLFGVIGIFVFPIGVIVIKLLNDEGIVHIWKSTKDPDKEDEKDEEKDGEENGSENKQKKENFSLKKLLKK